MSMKKTNYKEKLKKLRKKTGLSQAEFGKEFGIPKRTIESWEMGISSPRDYLYKFLEENVERWIDEKKKPPTS